MKKIIITIAVAVSIVGGSFADMMFADLAVGYGIYNSDGSAGIIADEIGQSVTIRVVSGISGISEGGTLSYLVDLNSLGSVLNAGGPQTFVIDLLGEYQDYSVGNLIRLDWQAYDADAWIIVTGTGTSEAYVTNVGSLIEDRAYDEKGLPNGINYDNNALGANANAIVIPEPATIGLMGIAGLGMFLARRKVRR